jgi:hypothetical protein
VGAKKEGCDCGKTATATGRLDSISSGAATATVRVVVVVGRRLERIDAFGILGEFGRRRDFECELAHASSAAVDPTPHRTAVCFSFFAEVFMATEPGLAHGIIGNTGLERIPSILETCKINR